MSQSQPPELVTPWTVQTVVVASWLGWTVTHTIEIRDGRSLPDVGEMLDVRALFGWSLDDQADARSAGTYPAWFDHHVRAYAAILDWPPCACGCGGIFPGSKFGWPHHLRYLNRAVASTLREGGDGPKVRAQIELEHPDLLNAYDKIVWHRRDLARKKALRRGNRPAPGPSR